MKAITIIGRLTKDGEVQENEKGQFVRFSVAVDDGYGMNKSTMFFDVTYNRTQIAQYLTKGTTVGVTGELKAREHNGKTYLSVRPNEVKLLGGNNNRETVQHREHEAPQRPQFNDEIPF